MLQNANHYIKVIMDAKKALFYFLFIYSKYILFIHSFPLKYLQDFL